jgi:flavin reductase (DIM6/NTAB) family NADH-FMN oxidoreductase RutF
MNADEIKSALSQLATALLAILTAAGVITSGQAHDVAGAIAAIFTSLGTLVPAVLLIANVAGSIWRHWNMKKVPETAIVVAPAK